MRNSNTRAGLDFLDEGSALTPVSITGQALALSLNETFA